MDIYTVARKNLNLHMKSVDRVRTEIRSEMVDNFKDNYRAK